ncbi:lipopolysaccharide biosynthesis protein [Rossellomorea sp. BNER]|uniref:lipopolysaccharide biosynthesis protein n=1 Tax=Rossellomorea sp. BNER TaxID=2962031 RepID=UPI003AF2B9DC|nr:oligosaccharide flippase family protein [Rossellomorea sp. BNER]
MNNKFVSKAATLIKGTFLGQLIVLLTSPLITRMYSAEEFGNLAVYTSLLSITVVNASLKMETSILLPNSRKESLQLLVLCIKILILNTIILLLLILVFNNWIRISLVNIDKIYLYLLPISFLGLGLNQILTNLALKYDDYRVISRTKINQNFWMVFTQLSLGFKKTTNYGLLIGDVLGKISGNISLIKSIYINTKSDNFNKLNIFSVKNDSLLVKKYRHYPMYASLSNLFNNISMQSPPLIIAITFNSTTAGLFSLCIKVIEAPISMICKSLGQVLSRDMSSDFKNTKKNTTLLVSVVKKLAIIGFLVSFFLAFFGPITFKLIFGSGWEVAGSYARILSIMFFFEIIGSPLLPILDVYQKQKVFLYWQFIRVCLVLLSLIAVPAFTKNIVFIITIYSVSMAIMYAFLIILAFNTVKNYNNCE